MDILHIQNGIKQLFLFMSSVAPCHTPHHAVWLAPALQLRGYYFFFFCWGWLLPEKISHRLFRGKKSFVSPHTHIQLWGYCLGHMWHATTSIVKLNDDIQSLCYQFCETTASTFLAILNYAKLQNVLNPQRSTI